ncbi:carbonic anhydrase 4a [Latimeria chalumnae]|uniref:Carbonic anhydrase n=1 Tax=Latimeria chalumnae TaxID=7897 RepID=H3BCQ3_LATCH|nr:PREDICTED: carbonic anhydrase 4 [Latimeria chalumnae]|eukprot:XP_005986883.1 PREDICTED: carbonic anhydrase 4 [Latimeria chalumnae]
MELFLFFLALSTLPCISVGAGSWCYQSQEKCSNDCKGPNYWHEVDPICGRLNQSPININTKRARFNPSLKPFTFEGYDKPISQKLNIKNNGHSVQVTLPFELKIRDGGLKDTYKAVQFHLHWGSSVQLGSEHTIDGEQYPMELHIVHMKEKYSSLAEALKDKTGVAVLGFMYAESSKENPTYENLINALEEVKFKDKNASLSLSSLANMIPNKDDLTRYYRYNGSLTTPHCQEAVVWTVFEKAIPLSNTQLKKFPETLFYNKEGNSSEKMEANFRPVQKLNNRVVYTSSASDVVSDKGVLSFSLTVALYLSFQNA